MSAECKDDNQNTSLPIQSNPLGANLIESVCIIEHESNQTWCSRLFFPDDDDVPSQKLFVLPKWWNSKRSRWETDIQNSNSKRPRWEDSGKSEPPKEVSMVLERIEEWE